MHQTLKHFFIPHAENNYHPHFLHTKRAIFYSAFFLLSKIIVILFAILLPTSEFFSPKVIAAEQTKIVRLANILRQEQGVSRLKEIEPLDQSADLRARDMAIYQYFDHYGPANHDLHYFLRQTNYDYVTAGENLAVGSPVAEEILREWKNSPAHYANLLDPDFNHAGLGIETGVYQGRAVAYTALHFGKGEIVMAEHTASNSDNAIIKNPAAPAVKVFPTETLIQKYTRARNVLSQFFLIFPLSRAIFITASIVFIFALLLNIFIEIRKQHIHVIGQTLGVIFLLATLIII